MFDTRFILLSCHIMLITNQLLGGVDAIYKIRVLKINTLQQKVNNASGNMSFGLTQIFHTMWHHFAPMSKLSELYEAKCKFKNASFIEITICD